MRRGLAGMIVGLSLVVASVAWAAFVLTHTALDPGRSERLAVQLLDNETLRQAMVGRLSAAMEAALPAEVPVPRPVLEQAADAALENPEVEALVLDGIVAAHRNALEGNSEPVTLDAGALGRATRQSLVDARPELDAFLPASPSLSVEVPTGGLSRLGTLRRFALRVTWVLGTLSVAGALLALLITKDRPSVLRRVSTWAFGAAAFWLVVGFAVPYLARTIAPTSAALVAAMIDVFFGAMIGPAIAMAVFGGVLLAASMGWASLTDQRGARLAGAGPPARPPVRRAGGDPSLGGRQSNLRPGADGRTTTRATEPRSDSTTPTPAHPGSGRPSSGEPTSTYPIAPSAPRPAAPPTPIDAARPQRWIEGIGYVDDPAAKEIEPDSGGYPGAGQG